MKLNPFEEMMRKQKEEREAARPAVKKLVNPFEKSSTQQSQSQESAEKPLPNKLTPPILGQTSSE
jgi:hypothetical protein